DYLGRTINNWGDFLNHVEQWVPTEIERLSAMVDNLNVHRATDVLLFCLHHPRWEYVFQPKYAAYLNLLEPWWTTLRSLALTGRRFETWEEVVKAIEEATVYWNNPRHPYLWRRHRRHHLGGGSTAQLKPALSRCAVMTFDLTGQPFAART